MNTRDITLKDFSKVSVIFQIITNLESSSLYVLDDPRICNDLKTKMHVKNNEVTGP